MSNLRISDTHGYLLYREVEPVQPYPRIDPQQPQDEKPRNREEPRSQKEELTRRRFIAMRSMIEGLKKRGRIARVDYSTLVSDLAQIGVGFAEKELLDLLRTHRVTPEGLSHLSEQILRLIATPDLGFGPTLEEAHNFLPHFAPGLSEVHLRYLKLELLPGQEGPLLVEAISGDGLYRCATRHLQMECRPLVKTQYDSALELNIHIVVGVGEVDEANRRAILYQREPSSFALYTDKQIDLSI